MSEEEWENYLKEYEQLYKKHIREKKRKFPNLIELLSRFDVDIYKPTKIYRFMRKLEDKIEKDLSLNKNEERLFEYWRVCENNVTSDIVEYAFIYGFSFGMGLKNESKELIKYNLENKI